MFLPACCFTYTKQKKKGIETVFIYITDLPVSDSNIVETIYFGRKRWKIENEGFNMQKNGTFDIEHLYSKNEIAIKANYLLIQIAHTIRQLLEQGSVKINNLNLKIKEISTMIKKTLISKILNLVEHNKIQLRFII